YLKGVQRFDAAEIPQPENLSQTLLDLMGSPNLGSRDWITSQYDQTVRTNTLVGPGSDAAVVRVKGTRRALAMTSDCNHRWCYLDPRAGAAHAVAEAARNLSCSGARPLGVTDCLNFGNPENPEIMWQFREAIRGMGDACRALGVPVVSGNVSFYNETRGQAIHPAPVVAMVGLLEDASTRLESGFPSAGLTLLLLGDAGEPSIAASEYLAQIHGREAGAPPPLDLEMEKRLGELLRGLAGRRLLASAHDCSDGGLAVTLAECCLVGPVAVGAHIRLPEYERADAALFGEASGRVLVAVVPAQEADVAETARQAGVPCTRLGTTNESGRVRIEGPGDHGLVDLALDDLQRAWSAALPEMLE
ncbi:MAG: phosphoribosylformylglycinamidine synthase II, partial [Acidobacteria bacterium]